MSGGEVWTTVVLVALVTFAIKGIGPALLGPGREGGGEVGRDPLPAPLARVVPLLAPPLLTALVCTQALADGPDLALGGDTLGVAAAGVLLWRGATVLPAVLVAVVVAAVGRLLGLP